MAAIVSAAPAPGCRAAMASGLRHLGAAVPAEEQPACLLRRPRTAARRSLPRQSSGTTSAKDRDAGGADRFHRRDDRIGESARSSAPDLARSSAVRALGQARDPAAGDDRHRPHDGRRDVRHHRGAGDDSSRRLRPGRRRRRASGPRPGCNRPVLRRRRPCRASAAPACCASHWKPSVSGRKPVRAAIPATSSGTKTRKPVAAARPMPSAMLSRDSSDTSIGISRSAASGPVGAILPHPARAHNSE